MQHGLQNNCPNCRMCISRSLNKNVCFQKDFVISANNFDSQKLIQLMIFNRLSTILASYCISYIYQQRLTIYTAYLWFYLTVSTVNVNFCKLFQNFLIIYAFLLLCFTPINTVLSIATSQNLKFPLLQSTKTKTRRYQHFSD